MRCSISRETVHYAAVMDDTNVSRYCSALYLAIYAYVVCVPVFIYQTNISLKPVLVGWAQPIVLVPLKKISTSLYKKKKLGM
jgi:hypothetical protein